MFAHSKLGLQQELFAIYAFLRFNVSLRQVRAEFEVTYDEICRRVERFTRALDTPRLDLVTPVEIDEVYVAAGLKPASANRSRARGPLHAWARNVRGDRPPVFVLVDRGAEQRYVIPAKSTVESMIRLLLADRREESITVYTDGFRATIRWTMLRISTVKPSSTAAATHT